MNDDHLWMSDNLGVDVRSPETAVGACVGVGGEERLAGGGEGVVDELEDDEGLAHGLAPDDEDGDLGLDGVGGQQQRALGRQVLGLLLVGQEERMCDLEHQLSQTGASISIEVNSASSGTINCQVN
jgi:hypothetical protein